MSLRILFAIHGPRDARTAVFLTRPARAEFLRRRGTRGRHRHAGRPRRSAGGRGCSRSCFPWRSRCAAPARLRRRRPPQPPGLGSCARRAPGGAAARRGRGVPRARAAVSRCGCGGAGAHRRARVSPVRAPAPAHRAAAAAGSRAAGPIGVFCLNSPSVRFCSANGWAEPARVSPCCPTASTREVFVAGARSTGRQARRLVFMGQWLRAKGHEYLTEAFAAIAARYPEAELTCLGTGADSARVFARLRRGREASRAGAAEPGRRSVAHELARADLFLFPSLSEGFSGALLEAMAAASPSSRRRLVPHRICCRMDAQCDGRSHGRRSCARRRRLCDARRSGPRRDGHGGAGGRVTVRMGSGEPAVRRRAAPRGEVRMTDGRRSARRLRRLARTRVRRRRRSIRPGTIWCRPHSSCERDLEGRTVLEIACGRGEFAQWCDSRADRRCWSLPISR